MTDNAFAYVHNRSLRELLRARAIRPIRTRHYTAFGRSPGSTTRPGRRHVAGGIAVRSRRPVRAGAQERELLAAELLH